jgi:hypothetical protein
MKRLRKFLIVLFVLGGILLLLMYSKVYVVRGSAGGTLYWNKDQALVFMQVGSSGARLSYLRYAFEPLLVALSDIRQPDDQRCSQTFVIQITDKDVQRFDTDLNRYAEDPYCGIHFDLFEGRIYAVHGRLWKWSGTEFEAATQEEVRAFDAAKASTTAASHPWEFDDLEGWSMRKLGLTRPEYHLVLNGQPATVVISWGETWPQRPMTVDLTRPGQPPKTIWSFDGRPHTVSKAEYERLFPRRDDRSAPLDGRKR